MKESSWINLWPGLAELLTEETELFSGRELHLTEETRDLMGAMPAA